MFLLVSAALDRPEDLDGGLVGQLHQPGVGVELCLRVLAAELHELEHARLGAENQTLERRVRLQGVGTRDY